MCIFTGNPDGVSETRIFVAPCSEKTTTSGWFTSWFQTTNNNNEIKKNGKQITVYGNTVSTSSPVAMILPVPNKDGSAHSIEMIDTSGVDADTFFSQLKECFPQPPKMKSLSTRGFLSTNAYSADSLELEVKRAGSYRYSVVPSMKDFDRLNHHVFNVTLFAEVKDLLRTHYHTGFSFLVCIIDQGAQYKPIAYVHSMMDGNRLFIPTRHFHGNTSHYHNDHNNRYSLLSHAEAPDWDHEIYVAGMNRECEFGINAKMDNALALVTPNAITQKCIYSNLSYSEFRRQEIRAWNAKRWPNNDIILQAAAA